MQCQRRGTCGTVSDRPDQVVTEETNYMLNPQSNQMIPSTYPQTYEGESKYAAYNAPYQMKQYSNAPTQMNKSAIPNYDVIYDKSFDSMIEETVNTLDHMDRGYPFNRNMPFNPKNLGSNLLYNQPIYKENYQNVNNKSTGIIIIIIIIVLIIIYFCYVYFYDKKSAPGIGASSEFKSFHLEKFF